MLISILFPLLVIVSFISQEGILAMLYLIGFDLINEYILECPRERKDRGEYKI